MANKNGEKHTVVLSGAEAEIAIAGLRAYAAGELGFAMSRYGMRHPRRAEFRDRSEAATAVADRIEEQT